MLIHSMIRLMQKKISPLELLDFCQRTGFDAIDFTGYYFSTYPGTPSDEEIYGFKRKAHSLGLEISGTGIRNEFSFDKGDQLDKEIDLVKRWIEVTSKLGAPVLRIYTAKKYYTGEERIKNPRKHSMGFEQVLANSSRTWYHFGNSKS